MGALEDYYKRQNQLILAAAQANEVSHGRDPALVNQPSAAPAPGASPLGVAAGGGAPGLDPRLAGSSGSYVPQSNGGVDPGNPTFLERAFGQDQTKVTAATQATLSDKGDIPAVNAAMADYDARHKAWEQQMVATVDRVKNGSFSDKVHSREIIDGMLKQEPAKPDLQAIQHQSDRDRLLSTIGGAYQPLIAQLQESAAGRGPSAALNTYRAAADDASSRNYGLAASARGTGGQRAALFHAALGQNAQDAQGAARQSAIIAAQEQNSARAALNSSLQGLTNVYGTSNLLGDTQHQQDRNQDAYNEAIGINARIQSENADRASKKLDQAVDTGAKLAGGV